MSDSNSVDPGAQNIAMGCVVLFIILVIVGIIVGLTANDDQAELAPAPSADPRLPLTEETIPASDENTETEEARESATEVALGVHSQYQSGNCNEQDLAFAIATSVQEGVDEVMYIGETKRGRLSSSDEIMDDGTYFDIWVLYVCEATDVVIDMRSNAIDSYLLLSQWPNRNPDVVRQVADDDDSGNGQDSRITRRLAPGVYGIVPSTFLPESGPYEISVQARR